MTEEQQKIASKLERECNNIYTEMCFAKQQAEMASVIAQGLAESADDGHWDFPPRFVSAMERMLEYMRDVRRCYRRAREAYQILRILRADQLSANILTSE